MVNTAKTDFNPSIKTIMLVPVRDSSSIESSLEIGNTGFYFNDLSDGKYLRITAKTVDMGINNFIYLGFNSESGIFSDKLMRQAVNLAINRNEIVNTAFQGHAREAYSPFNPDWYALASKDLIITGNIQKAAELIDQSEFDITDVTVSLLVNKNNQFKLETAEFVKNSLESLGFKVKLKDYETDYYTEAVKMGAYDIYIGEIRLSPNMNLSPLLGDGEANYGIDPFNEACLRYGQFLSGGCELMDFINSFNENLPLVPICYRNAAASYTNAMNSDFNCCDADVFYDIETWSFK
jgi:peptide/nickel transport system substrate-binding protein